MLRYVLLLVSISASATGAVAILNDNPEMLETASTVVGDRAETRRAQTAVSKQVPLSGVERLRADSRGHYVAEFTLNSSRATGVIDTGATMIAMGPTQARRSGVSLRDQDFVYDVSTANGVTKAARVVLDEVRLGSIRLRNVEALVLEDDLLDVVLIGMSFLKRLKNFEFSNGMLEMRI